MNSDQGLPAEDANGTGERTNGGSTSNNGSTNQNTNTPPTPSTAAFLQLIASLFELSKAANEASKAAVDFFNVVDAKPQYMAPPLFDQGLLTPQPQHMQGAQGAQQANQAAVAAAQQMSMSAGQVPGVPQQQQRRQQHQQPPQQQQQQQQAGEEPKKKRRVRDPNAPPKPLTSFFLYSNYMRDVIIAGALQSGEGTLSQPDIAKETSRRWKMLSDQEKFSWKVLYEDQKKKYDVELKKYNLSKETGQPYTPPKKNSLIIAPASYPKKRATEDKRSVKKKKRKSSSED